MDVDDWTWVIDNEKLQYKRALFIKKTLVKAGIRKRIMVISGGILTVLYKGMKDGALTDLANRYNSIFECDRDGVVTISELTKQMGKQPLKFFQSWSICLKRDILRENN